MSKAKKKPMVKLDPVYSIVVDGFVVTGSLQWCERIRRTAMNREAASVSEITKVRRVK